MDKRNNKISSLLFAAVLCLWSSLGFTVQLGQSKLFSYKDEPLIAEITLSDADHFPPEKLLASLASSREFKRAGVARPIMLTKLRFEISRVNGHNIVKVTSKEPVTVSNLEFLVDLTWPKGRVVRGYVVQLEPIPNTQQAVTQAPIQKINATASSRTFEGLFDSDLEKEYIDKEAIPIATKAPLVTVEKIADQSQQTTKHSKSFLLSTGVALLLAAIAAIAVFVTAKYQRKIPALSIINPPNSPFTKEAVTPSLLLPTTSQFSSEEIQLKLELAKQYLEIEDCDSASEILNYVILRGNEAEKKIAMNLLLCVEA